MGIDVAGCTMFASDWEFLGLLPLRVYLIKIEQ